jgi:hypothetical protein
MNRGNKMVSAAVCLVLFVIYAKMTNLSECLQDTEGKKSIF